MYNGDYGNYAPPAFSYNPEPPFVTIQREKKSIRYLSVMSGLALLIYIFISYGASIAVGLTGILNGADEITEYLYEIVMTAGGILLPFLVIGLLVRRKTGDEVLCFDAPAGKWLMLTSVFWGFAACVIGSYVTNVLADVLDDAGIHLTSFEFDTPATLPGRLIYVLAIAVFPALAEELALRGTVMQPLRRYGETYAVIVSALVFAIMHGNLIQAPFAFIAGIAIGYADCITGTIWTGVIIHFINNLYSCLLEFIVADIPSEKTQNIIYILSMALIVCVGGIAALAFAFIKGDRCLRRSPTMISGSRKAGAYFCSVPMIIAILFMLVITSQFVTIG